MKVWDEVGTADYERDRESNASVPAVQPTVERDMTGYGDYLMWLAAEEDRDLLRLAKDHPGKRKNGWGEWVPTGRPGDDYYGSTGIALNECAHPRPREATDAEYGEWILRQFEDEPRMPKFPPITVRNEFTGEESYEYQPGQEPDPVGDAWLFVQSIDAHQRSVRERLERYAQQRRP